MTGVAEKSALQSLLGDAMAGVIEATNTGRLVSIDSEVARLLNSHPDCDVTLNEMKAYLMIFAVDVLAPIDVGSSEEEAAPHTEHLMREFYRMLSATRGRREAA